jgi:hypothetical protein
VTEESKNPRTATGSGAPGSGAGDSAPTQAIPRIPKQGTQGAAGQKPTGTTPKPSGSSSQTDKGRPRQVPPATGGKPAASGSGTKPGSTPAASPAPAASTGSGTKPAASTGSGTKPQVEPAGGPKGRTLTAADYARTTKQSPASTAVIPAVKDKPGQGTSDKGASGKESAKDSTAATPASAASAGRRASLHLTHVEPWSVTRLAFAISVAMMIVAVVAATIFWIVLELAGVWGQINDSFTSVLSDDSSSFDVKDYFGFWRVFGLTLVLSAINVVITTALATIGAHLYNLAAQLMGGVEVTFTEER